jgi:predicted nucleic acid-binding protein
VKLGLTFDAGALIALERRSYQARLVMEKARARRALVTVPTPVLAEWWRGRSDRREQILGGVRIEPLSAQVARLAGEALAVVRGATVIDAIVMASASLRNDIVYTSDFEDLDRLTSFFPGVRVLAI